MPAYQYSAVSAYLNSGATLPGAQNFNPSGRGYPDVAAIGHNVFVRRNAVADYLDGTSASAPIFAAILALANNALFSSGKNPVGFVNPSIYWIASTTHAAFYDINCSGCVNDCNTQGW